MEKFATLDNQLCFAVYEAASEFNKLYTKALHPFGLTYPQYLVLLALWEKDDVTLKGLGERLNLGTGTLTPMIRRMEEKGWLKKVRSKEDERRVYISLEPKAWEEKPAITEQISRDIQSCQIELEEYDQLMTQLNTLRKKIRERQG